MMRQEKTRGRWRIPTDYPTMEGSHEVVRHGIGLPILLLRLHHRLLFLAQGGEKEFLTMWREKAFWSIQVLKKKRLTLYHVDNEHYTRCTKNSFSAI